MDYAIRLPKTRRKRPWSPWTKLALAFFCWSLVCDFVCAVATFEDSGPKLILDAFAILFLAVGFVPVKRDPPAILPFGWYWYWHLFRYFYEQDRNGD